MPLRRYKIWSNCLRKCMLLVTTILAFVARMPLGPMTLSGVQQEGVTNGRNSQSTSRSIPKTCRATCASTAARTSSRMTLHALINGFPPPTMIELDSQICPGIDSTREGDACPLATTQLRDQRLGLSARHARSHGLRTVIPFSPTSVKSPFGKRARS